VERVIEGGVLLGKRRRLGGELRRHREQAGVPGRQLAERIGISQSKISRIESGTALPTIPEVTAWAAAVGASGDEAGSLLALAEAAYTEVHPWNAALQDHGHLQDDIQELENRTGVKRVYEPSVIPGLLQTADYVRRIFTMFQPAYAEPDIPAVVAGRLDRQVALFDSARQFEFLITEAALRWRIGPVGLLRAQLDRIASVSTLENVSIGLIPQTAPALTHVPHGFVIFEPNGDEDDVIVMVETVHANLTVGEAIQVELYHRQWSLLAQTAVYGASARDLLAEIATDICAPGKDDCQFRKPLVEGDR
jgi:transcriptional regulator with XRE-family HTH domain